MSVHAMLETHPLAGDAASAVLEACIEATLECASACTACADASLAEEDVEDLRACIARCLDCADVCAVTARVLIRRTAADPALEVAIISVCARVCGWCAEECERHADHHEHCRICA